MEEPCLKDALKYGGYVLFHPFKGFYELKYERRGKLSAGMIFLGIYFFSITLRDSLSGYLYTDRTGTGFSLLVCLLKAVAPLFLFCLANWCLTLPMNGEGTMSQLFTALCYAFLPMAINNLLYTLLSNFFSLDESLYLQLIAWICIAWTAILILTAVLETNQYSFGRATVSCLVSVVGIAVLLLLILLCSDLISQVFEFIRSILKELSYR